MNLSYPLNSQSFNIQCTINESIDPGKVGMLQLTISKTKLLFKMELGLLFSAITLTLVNVVGVVFSAIFK